MLYDFYYSAKNEEHEKKLAFYGFPFSYCEARINGQIYSEMIKEGKTPLLSEKFDDLVKVYTGGESGITLGEI